LGPTQLLDYTATAVADLLTRVFKSFQQGGKNFGRIARKPHQCYCTFNSHVILFVGQGLEKSLERHIISRVDTKKGSGCVQANHRVGIVTCSDECRYGCPPFFGIPHCCQTLGSSNLSFRMSVSQSCNLNIDMLGIIDTHEEIPKGDRENKTGKTKGTFL